MDTVRIVENREVNEPEDEAGQAAAAGEHTRIVNAHTNYTSPEDSYI